MNPVFDFLSWRRAVSHAPVLSLLVVLALPEKLLADPITLLHSWRSPSESKSIVVLESDIESKGLEFTYQLPMAEDLNNIPSIQKLTNSLNREPTFLALNNETLRYWYDLGLVHGLTSIAEEQDWQEKYSEKVLQAVTYRGQVFAAPVSMHISNWVWANKPIIDATGLSLTPNWDDFVTLLEALDNSGVVPIAHDGSEEQDILLFETVYLSLFGAEEYNLVFDELNSTGLRRVKENFRLVFERLQILKPYITRIADGAMWNVAAQQLIDGKAALIIQGDWIQGELMAEGGKANQHYYCARFPGPFDTVSLKVEAIASLNSVFSPLSGVQRTFYQSITTEAFNRSFNSFKGGLPARKDTLPELDNECSILALDRIADATQNNALVLSVSQSMSVREAIKSEIGAVINQFMTTEMTSDDAAIRLQKRMKYASYIIN